MQGEAQGKQNPGDQAAFLTGPAAPRADGLTSGISIKTSIVAAAGSVPEPWAFLLGAIHCHWERASASWRCLVIFILALQTLGLCSRRISQYPNRLFGHLPASAPSFHLSTKGPQIASVPHSTLTGQFLSLSYVPSLQILHFL